jgi:hypothetical protein
VSLVHYLSVRVVVWIFVIVILIFLRCVYIMVKPSLGEITQFRADAGYRRYIWLLKVSNSILEKLCR